LIRTLQERRAASRTPLLRGLPLELRWVVRSPGYDSPGTIRIVNLTSRTLSLDLIDPNGQMKRYGTIAPFSEHRQRTGIAQYWLVGDDAENRPIAIFRLSGPEGLALVGDGNPENTELPDDTPGLLALYGEAFQKRGEFRRAEEAFDRAVTRRPDDALARALRSRFLAITGRADEAARELHRAVDMTGDDAQSLVGLANDMGRRGNWAEAAAVLDRVIALRPDDHWNWYLRGPVFLLMGDSAGYRRHCAEAQDRFQHAADPGVLERISKIGLLLPPAEDQTSTLTDMAQGAIERMADTRFAPYFLVTRALAAYRAGDDVATDRLLRKADSSGIRNFFGPRVSSEVIRLLLETRRGDRIEARAALDRMTALFQNPSPALPVAYDGEWWEWAIAMVLQREAERAFYDSIFPPDPFAH
jgi:tetratricopeptide (TPR) repeat protein